MQTEILVTGIGGQGVQFATRTVAAGAMASGRTVMLTSEFGGEMRGGISTATLIAGDPPLQALPVVPTAAAVVGMHDKFWPLAEHRLRPGGLLLVNSSLWERAMPPGFQIVQVPATKLALAGGFPMAAGLLLAGAFATLTGLATIDDMCGAMERLLPGYRRQHLAANVTALRAGAGLVTAGGMRLLPPPRRAPAAHGVAGGGG
ncbi:MAG TPA: 2-oxoacid:acceptor oxidoreductase family protein [Streptosporangiaceae bacterium]|nr:2-oxoacid:acceptor oxidoreductase family protein [Streptosporangiaceae bacterium]